VSSFFVASMVRGRAGGSQKLLSNMNYLFYQLFTSVHILQRHLYEHVPGSEN
jgi:hypothetical protein